MISDQILSFPDYTKKFTIQCDASNYGIGAILVQGEGDDERIIAYMSEKLSPAQRKYQTTERECLAVIRAIEKFRPYIKGTKFIVVTDHASLLWLTNLKDPSGRVGRWALRLQAYDYELVHRKGKFMVVADALSRAICKIDTAPTDKWYDDLKNKIAEFPNKFPQFQIENGQIYKYCHKGNLSNCFSPSWKWVVPALYRASILHKYHDDPTSAHQGFHKTCEKIKHAHYWPKMDLEIQNYIRKCEVCKCAKPSKIIQRALMGKQRETSRPWHIIQLDFLGPLPRSKQGFCYILVVIDTFSKFVLLSPMRRATSKSTITYLENDVFLLFGIPEVIISDNGSQFISAEFKRLCKSYGIKQWLTAAYHPQANATEAANKTISIAIRSYIQHNNDHRDWDVNLQKIACALNSSVHSSIKCSPYVVNFGQHIVTNQHAYTSLTTVNRNSEHFDKIRKAIMQNLTDAHASSKRKYYMI